MAMFALAQEWHAGEKEMHSLMKSPEHDNPTVGALSQQLAMMLPRGPLLAIGCLDADGNPWTTVWGGATGIAAAINDSVMGIRTKVEAQYDPVVQALVGGNRLGEVVKEEGVGRMVGGLSINLETRKRVKLYGRMIAGAVSQTSVDETEKAETGALPRGESVAKEQQKNVAELQLVVKVEQSLGNCPKYLNKRVLSPAVPSPVLKSDSPQLPQAALDLISKSDLFFMSSSQANEDMDTNHRGGPAGFVRIVANDESGAEIIYPEYSGNRLYQTLGNLRTTPRAGLVFPDFHSGDVLYMTGRTRILVGKDASSMLPHSNLAVNIKIAAARFVQNGMPFRGIDGEMSPYNPNVRLLASEGNLAAKFQASTNTAKLVDRTRITPSIYRYRFAMTNPVRYEPGQWIALDFANELDTGYSHMRDDDPRSLNDDWIRTFTISSSPGDANVPLHDQFEITARSVGPVTRFMSGKSFWEHAEVPIRGFGGDFKLQTSAEEGSVLGFVAGGVGITPLLGQLPGIELEKLRLFWTVRIEDAGLVADVFARHPGLGSTAAVFVTGSIADVSSEQSAALSQMREEGARVVTRRISKADLDAIDAETWHLCAPTSLQKALLEMLQGKKVLYESFNY